MLGSLVARRSRERLSRAQSTVLAAAGFALAVHFGTWIASLEYTSVAVSTLLVSTAPIFTAAYDAIVKRRGLSLGTSLAFLAGSVGLALVVGFDRTAAPHPGAHLLGETLAVIGAMAIAAYLLLVRTVRASLSTATIVTRTYGCAAIALAASALLARQPLPPWTDGAAWGGIVAMAMISQLLGHTALNASLRWFSPSAVSFASVLEPVFAAALAFLIFGEALAPLAVVGGVILLAAVVVVAKNEREDIAPEL